MKATQKALADSHRAEPKTKTSSGWRSAMKMRTTVQTIRAMMMASTLLRNVMSRLRNRNITRRPARAKPL